MSHSGDEAAVHQDNITGEAKRTFRLRGGKEQTQMAEFGKRSTQSKEFGGEWTAWAKGRNREGD